MNKRVLLIEDNEPNRVLETDLLESGGFEVVTAVDAATGFAAAKKERPDLIVIDLRLPDMSGTKLAEMLSQDRDLKKIPVVFVTADIVGNESNILRSSGYKFLTKPVDPLTFADEVGSCMI